MIRLIALAALATSPAMAQEQSTHEWCYSFALLQRKVAESRDQGIPLSEAVKVLEEPFGKDAEVFAFVSRLAGLTYEYPSLAPAEIFELEMARCIKERTGWEELRSN